MERERQVDREYWVGDEIDEMKLGRNGARRTRLGVYRSLSPRISPRMSPLIADLSAWMDG